MQISTWVLAASQDQSLALVPFDESVGAPLSEDERETLRSIPEEIIHASNDALPLHVYLMGGSSWTLAIFPSSGKIEMEGAEQRLGDGERTVTVFPNPYGS